jgi:hypothetical protein
MSCGGRDDTQYLCILFACYCCRLHTLHIVLFGLILTNPSLAVLSTPPTLLSACPCSLRQWPVRGGGEVYLGQWPLLPPGLPRAPDHVCDGHLGSRVQRQGRVHPYPWRWCVPVLPWVRWRGVWRLRRGVRPGGHRLYRGGCSARGCPACVHHHLRLPEPHAVRGVVVVAHPRRGGAGLVAGSTMVLLVLWQAPTQRTHSKGKGGTWE